jgi:hypothetical protein
MATTESTKSKSNFTKKLIIAEQVVILTAIVAGVSFYGGMRFQSYQNAKTAAAIHDAVKAATTPATAPNAVAQASKN